MILIFIGTVFIFLLIYPYLIYPALIKLLSKYNGPDFEFSNDPPSDFSLLFCAYNEEASLKNKINNLKEIKSNYPNCEILAYSDASDDKTSEILTRSEVVDTVIVSDKRQGKAYGMSKLVAKSSNSILIFTDANVTVEPHYIVNLLNYFGDKSVGTVACRLEYLSPDSSGTSVTADVGGMYWRLEEQIKKYESLTGNTMGADGSMFATRASLYPEVPRHLLDDLIASITPIFSGFRVISADDVICNEELTSDSRDEFRRKKRIACRAFETNCYLWPSLRKMSYLDLFKYISHKLIRWFGIYFLLLGSVFFCLGMISVLGVGTVLILGAFGAAVIIIGLVVESTWCATLIEILLSLSATGLGVFESILGKRYVTWTPPSSRN